MSTVPVFPVRRVGCSVSANRLDSGVGPENGRSFNEEDRGVS